MIRLDSLKIYPSNKDECTIIFQGFPYDIGKAYIKQSELNDLLEPLYRKFGFFDECRGCGRMKHECVCEIE